MNNAIVIEPPLLFGAKPMLAVFDKSPILKKWSLLQVVLSFYGDLNVADEFKREMEYGM